MAITWIEVADTAVKIGLGAIIGGISSYLLATTTHKHNISRDLTARKIRLLEVACEEAEKFFSYTILLYNKVSIFSRDNNISRRDQSDFESDFIIEAHDGFLDALLARNKAMAHISLLGSTESLDFLAKYSDTLERYRKIISYQREIPSREENEIFIKEFQFLKNSFYLSSKIFFDKVSYTP
ncbi:hypothetical protein AB8810_06975 [Xanthomonas sp. NCPPB 3005]|uniref:hypothetical protein n=1 Tax=Xanthomonas sp. NCPPB 3005 TaxID=3240913 RepID=UPI003516CD70